MVMLGLAEYGDTPSPAPAAAEPDPGSQRSVLSIVDYKAEDPDDGNAVAARKQAAAALGVSLDEDSVKHVSQPGRVGGVGARFTTEIKRSGSGGGSSAEAAESSAGSTSAEAGPPKFVVPDSPPGDADPRLLERHAKNVQHHLSGRRVNDYIRNMKKFRNPHLLDQLTNFLGTESHGTNYPKHLYDPTAFGEHEYYENLEAARKEWEVRQSRKQGEAVAFRSAGAQQLQPPQAASSAAPAAPVEQAPVKRKSKWDTGGDAKRSAP